MGAFNKKITFFIFFTILLFLVAIYISNTIAQVSVSPQYSYDPLLFAGYNTMNIGPGASQLFTSFSYSNYGGSTYQTTATCPGTQPPTGGGGTSLGTGFIFPSLTGLTCYSTQPPISGGGTSLTCLGACATYSTCYGTQPPTGGGGISLAGFTFPSITGLTCYSTQPPIGGGGTSSTCLGACATYSTCAGTQPPTGGGGISLTFMGGAGSYFTNYITSGVGCTGSQSTYSTCPSATFLNCGGYRAPTGGYSGFLVPTSLTCGSTATCLASPSSTPAY